MNQLNLRWTSFQYHPSGYAFASASEDKSARMFDIRSDQQVANYAPSNPNSGFTSCGTPLFTPRFYVFVFFFKNIWLIYWTLPFASALSLSGRYLFCGSDDNSVHTWDTLTTTYTGLWIDFVWFFRWINVQCYEIDLIIHINDVHFIGSLNGHENRVTSVTMAPSGFALVSCSWDQYVRVWGWMYSII